ncbi:Gfo/Idh/MocA family protein [Nocardiopsis sp. CA-288880]|uniref:Gfo/Idh/MocA family protein n=1 Tax=Nocardiopsis sp. CA-288880 TaxID=3239995 RepID=UPI003D99F449
MRLDIGLIGATRIAERAVIGPSRRHGDTTVRAVAASDRDRAAAYASRNRIPLVHDDYAELIADPDVNTVYISLHSGAHAAWTVRAAEAGKDVVVEKPLCLFPGELADVRRAAEANGVQVVEAVPTAGHPWQAVVHGMIAERAYGPLRSIRTGISFSVPGPGNYRLRPELGGGAFHDSAGYWLQAVQATAGLDCSGRNGRIGSQNGDGADTSFHARLSWPNGVRAELDCGFGDRHVAEHEFAFTGATVRVRGFLRPVAGALPMNLAIRHSDGSTEIRSFAPVAYYDHQFDTIRGALLTGHCAPGLDLAAAARRIETMAAIHRDAVCKNRTEEAQ